LAIVAYFVVTKLVVDVLCCCNRQVHLCELIGGISEPTAGPAGRSSTLVTVKTLCSDADEKARSGADDQT